jgi:CBS domain containing-hemolysin-like protein
VLALLDEGTRQGAIGPGVRQLADNAMRLRSTSVARVMVPWKSAERLELARGQIELLAQVARSAHTRLPVVDAAGRATGYVHQLEILAAIAGTGRAARLEEHLRPIEVLPADLPVDRALARLRLRGQRLALVGSAEKPAGLVSLKDLVEEISGQLERW